ncbi:MAG TPA: glycosyltransferase family 4 protein [Solirubrobacteraceae bacterium]|jgi:glycosyltransferase involved in cell wall biosynthesis|nr:glycosyltransferase family 4 protein [Solirubrobacteraceae bacterium]
MSRQIVHFHVGRSSHALFREQLRAAPEGFTYRSPHPQLDGDGAAATRGIAAHGRTMDWLREHGERAAIRSLSYAGFVRRARIQPLPGSVLVHSAQFLVRDCPLPYVVDFECLEAFALYQRVALRRPWARDRLRRALANPNLRFLLPWSEAARRGLQSALGPSTAVGPAERTVTVLPAIHPIAERPRARERGPLRVLFVGTAFLAKGGVEAMRAVERVRATHDVSLDMVSDVPDRWREEVWRSPGVTLHRWPAGGDVVRGLFERSDVLLFPSHMDTLGFVMLEAMAHGMPVLAARHFATPEIVEHEVSGLLCTGENLLYGEDGLCRFERTLPPPRCFRRALAAPSDAYLDRLVGALARLAEDRGLHERLAAGALERVRAGPLSVARRREALGRVYRQALAG